MKNDSRSGITCSIFRAKNETEHFHSEIELLFIINGHIHVVVEGNEFRISSQEFLLINSSKNHYIYIDDEALCCRFNISYEMMKQVFREEYIAFWCNTLTEKDTGYPQLREITREIIRLKLSEDPQNGFRLLELYARLMDSLTRNYKISTLQEGLNTDRTVDSRMQEIISYINNNYNEPINLADLADRMYVSLSTLSRSFRKNTGVKFPDYVNRIRLHHAIDDLLGSNKSMTEIAIDNGFSSPSSFNRVFKDTYGTSPSQYKKSVRSAVDKSGETLTQEEASQVKQYLNEPVKSNKQEPASQIVPIYPESKARFQNMTTRCVSLGAFYQLTNSSVQQQIRQMSEQFHLQYIRMWNIFSPKCMIALSPDNKVLSFEQVDIVLDFLVSIHVHPFLDMTDHPECLIKNRKKLFFRREDSMGFQNREQWCYFLEKFMEHAVFRYGLEEVSQWIFEFGDFPADTDLDYYRNGFSYYENSCYRDVFEASFQIIKKHCPNALVGGPDWVLDGRPLDVSRYLMDWQQMNLFPDFYSVHLFPDMELKNGSNGSPEQTQDPYYMQKQLSVLQSRLKEKHAPERPVFVTEITTILSNRNALNDHCFRGTSVVLATNLFQGLTDMVCFWVATDRLSLHYAPPGILHGGSGLMSKDGIPKPSYYALYFMAKLGDRLLSKGADYLAVQNSPNNIYILCYNHRAPVFDQKMEEESVINMHNADTMFPDTETRTVSFMLHGLEAGKDYIIKRHVVNQDSGSIMDEWKRLGFEPEMRANDINYLKNICVPRIQMGHRVAEEGQIYLEAVMKPHEMLLLHIYR